MTSLITWTMISLWSDSAISMILPSLCTTFYQIYETSGFLCDHLKDWKFCKNIWCAIFVFLSLKNILKKSSPQPPLSHKQIPVIEGGGNYCAGDGRIWGWYYLPRLSIVWIRNWVMAVSSKLELTLEWLESNKIMPN